MTSFGTTIDGEVARNITNPSTQTSVALEAAIASASTGAVNFWKANTSYLIDAVVVAPDGTMIERTAAGTSRPTFDSTEQAAWNVVATETGTLQQIALSATYVPLAAGNITQDAPALGLYFPEAHGAKGDGSTDDHVALAAVHTACPVGATVAYRAGATYVTSVDIVPKAGTRIQGYGSTLQAAASTSGVNLLHPGDGIDVRGLTLDPNKANTTDPGADTQGLGIYVYNATGFTYPVVMKDLKVKAGWQLGYRVATGVFSVDPASNPVSDVLIEDVNVDSQNQRGARLLNLNGLKIRGGNITNSASDGLHIFSCADTTVTDTKCLSNGGHGLVTNYVARFAVKGVISRQNGFGGIVMGGGALTSSNTPSYDWSIIGCTTDYNGQSAAWSGIHVDPTVTGLSTTAQNAQSAVSDCVSAHNAVHGVYINNAGYVSVTGVVAHDNGNSGILTATADGLVDANICFNNGGFGIYVAGTASSTRNRMTVGVNYCVGNTSGQYKIDDATMDIRWARVGKAPNVQTANYNGTATDFFVEMNGTGLTYSLPDPTTVGPDGSVVFEAKNINASTLTINSQGTSKTIDGAASVTVGQWVTLRFVPVGGQWHTQTNNTTGLAPLASPTFTGTVTTSGISMTGTSTVAWSSSTIYQDIANRIRFGTAGLLIEATRAIEWLGTTGNTTKISVGSDIATFRHGASGFQHVNNAGSTALLKLSDTGGWQHLGDKLGFYSATTISRPTAALATAGYTAGSSTAVTIDGKFTGNVGSTAYTIADIVAALKSLGLITS